MMSLFIRGLVWKQVWILEARGLFLNSPSNVSGPERCFVVALFTFKIKVSIIFENDTMKLSVNEAKLTGLWARNCATI